MVSMKSKESIGNRLMSVKQPLKATLFAALTVLLIGPLCVQAAQKGGYVSDPSLYWSVGINNVRFYGRTSHSEHRYAIENYSTYDLSVTWEYAHKVMRANKTLYKDDSRHGTVTVKAGRDQYAGGSRGVDVVPGRYYIDAYTSVDILCEKRHPGVDRRIKYGKISYKTAPEDIL